MPAWLEFCAIDFETTGAVQGYPVEPWQVGCVRRCKTGKNTFYESLIRVGKRPFHPNAPGRHAQLEKQITQAPDGLGVGEALRPLLAGCPLVGHNVATEKKCLRTILPMENLGPWIDTLSLCRSAFPERPSFSLEDMVDFFQLNEALAQHLPGRTAHDALYDALASALILEQFLASPGWEAVTLEQLCYPDLRPYYAKRKI